MSVYRIVATLAAVPAVQAVHIMDGHTEVWGVDAWGDGSPVWDMNNHPPTQVPGQVLFGITQGELATNTLSALAAISGVTVTSQ